MEAIDQLTAGVAHDFNNLLAAILGNLEMLESRTDENASLKLLRNAAQSVRRGERLTGQLLAFARKQTLLPKAVDLNQIVADMSNLLQTSIGTTIRFEMRTKPGLWSALIDPNQIELVLLNLAINARDAMPRGGTLTIETSNATLSGAGRPADLPAVEYAVVSVSDTGTGMSNEVRAKAFEPFFTTKEIGNGSGLGLSMVLGVARQSGGTVQITGRSVEGTSIEVYLPRADSRVSSDGKAASPSIVSDHVVFLVDDGSDVRAVARKRHVDRNHIVGKPYRPDETLYKSSAHAWKKRRSLRTPLLHVLCWRACLEGRRRCAHQMMPNVAREAAWNLILNLLACHGVVCNVTTVLATEVTQMKFMLLPATFLMAASWVAAPAQAAGCLKGAAVGGVAGHYAGHHGVLGAGAGCVIGHHEATKRAREKAQQQQQGSSSDTQVSPNSGR